MKIGILGSGNVGQKLSSLFHGAGHEVLIGTREAGAAPGNPAVRHGSFAQAAEHGEVVIIAIPYVACEAVLPPLKSSLKGKVVVDATNPLNNDWSPLLLGEQSSAGEQIARLVPDSRVVKAFNTVFADSMTPERLNRGGMKASAFLCGNHPEANDTVAKLAQQAGFAPVNAGSLSCARYLEAMAHLNIQIATKMGGGTNAVFLYHQAAA
jgi:8-hydroxy-5-deazaflavin:NADPH oxidoreductase